MARGQSNSGTIDGKAPGVKELRAGKIMFVTSRAVGRIVRVERRGDDLAVTLGPASLTEIVRDADIRLDLEFAPESMSYQEVPDLPGRISDPGPLLSARTRPSLYSLASTSTVPAWRIAAPATRDAPAAALDGELPSALKESFKVSVGDWEIEPSVKSEYRGSDVGTKLNLKVQRKAPGLKFGVDATLLARKLHVRTSLPISEGKVGSSATFVVEGLEELGLAIWSGVESGLKDNRKVRIEVPVEAFLQIPPSPETAGIPIVAQVKTKFIVSTAFSAKNSTLEAAGRYGLKGPMGLENGTIVTPEFSVVQPILASLNGVSIGVSGIVFAFENRILMGVGTAAALAGPYVKVVISTGLSRGSDLGASLVVCKGATLKIDVGSGVGTQVSSKAMEILKSLLGDKIKAEFEVGEILHTVVNRSATVPDVPLCRG